MRTDPRIKERNAVRAHVAGCPKCSPRGGSADCEEWRRLTYAFSKAAVDNWTRPRMYHFGHMIGPNGEVSALCFVKPRAINMSKHVTWTTSMKATTCPKCLAAIKAMPDEWKATRQP